MGEQSSCTLMYPYHKITCDAVRERGGYLSLHSDGNVTQVLDGIVELGYNVLHPFGWDAFGLPAENAAIKSGIHPAVWTMKNVENMRRQLRSMGATFDWDAEVVTCQPDYYKWNQWLFLQFMKAGLAYRQMAPVDWCPKCNTTLAREQVWGEDRHCERCSTPVVKGRWSGLRVAICRLRTSVARVSAGAMMASQARNVEMLHERQDLLTNVVSSLVNAISAEARMRPRGLLKSWARLSVISRMPTISA